jgi:MoaA/NifB/PqqE/SkfB family radical SAM enzyme
MLDTVVRNYRKLKENDAFNILLHPRVLANYRLYQKEQQERPLIMKSQPIGIEIEMTNRCNLACIQCLRSLGLKPYQLGDQDFENYKKILAQFPYVMNLSLNGFGEPMMYKPFFDIVEYTRKERPWCKIGIYSNGMLINEERAQRLMQSGLTELNISIDAARPETFRKVRRGGKLETVHNNIRTLMRVKQETGTKYPMVGINFVMLNENEGELVEFVEQTADFGVDFINCITYAGYDWGFVNKRTPESYQTELDAAAKRMEELGVRCKTFPSDDISWTDPQRPFSCDFFWGSNFRVNFRGEVTLGCCSPFQETFSYGNVLETPFEQIWNNAFYQRNRDLANQHIAPNPTCESCDRYSKAFFAPRNEDTIALV